MEGNRSVSSGSAQQDDSWTCQRCGWVYPNAHPSAKHRRNHKKQCGKIKGFELRSELHKGGSSDEASSGDDSHAQKVFESGSAAPAVVYPNIPQSEDLLVTELNVPDEGKSHTSFLQGISASRDIQPEATGNESTRDLINIDTVKLESPALEAEPEPNNVSLDNTSKTPKEEKTMYATLVDRVEEPAHVLPGLYTDEAKDLAKDVKGEDPSVDLTTNKPLVSVEEHSKTHSPEVGRVDAIINDSIRLDSDRASSARAISASFSPKHPESITSLEEPSRVSQDETKITIAPCLDKIELAAHEPQGADSDHVKAKESLSILKEQGMNRQGSSQGDDSWTCRHCGWVYPNAHPSAKHRKKHKKQCGKIKGFELHTEPHNGGSSDEASSDEDVRVKKESVAHQPPQLLQAEEQTNETVATENLPQIVDHPATFVEGENITESASNSPQPREFSVQGDAPDRELGEKPNAKDISFPDMVPSVLPEVPQNVPFLDQYNLPAGDNKKDVSEEPDSLLTKESPKHLSMNEETLPNQGVSEEPDSLLTKESPKHLSMNEETLPNQDVSEEPDSLLTKESPKHLSMNEETLPNQASGQGFLESSETQVNALPSSKSDETSASENCGVLRKDTYAEDGSTTKFTEEPPGLSAEHASNFTSNALVSDLMSSDASPLVYVEDTGASVPKVDEPSADFISAMDSRVAGLNNETLVVPAGDCLNESVILKEEKDVSEKTELSGLDTASNLNALDHDPLGKENGDISIGGPDGQLEPETISSDLPFCTLPADKVSDENKSLPADQVPDEKNSVTGNLLSSMALSTANVTSLTNDANEEEKFPSVQNSANPIQLVPENESLVQMVAGGTDDAFLSAIDKTDEASPVTNMVHLFNNQMVSSTVDKTDKKPPVTNMEQLLDNETAAGVAEVDVPKDVAISVVTSGETIPIQKSRDESASKNVSLVAEDSGQEEAGDKENTNTRISITKDTGEVDIAKESEEGGIAEVISSVKDGKREKTEASRGLEETVKSEVGEETPSETAGIGSSVASHALEAMVEPEAKEETLSETGDIGSSDLSYNETYSFTRSESGLTARSELGASSHKLSDSLDIFEDAPDSLETCSLGGSVDGNESLDEPRQASDRLQDEPKLRATSLDERVPGDGGVVSAELKHSGTTPLNERVPGDGVAAEQNSSVTNSSRSGEASSEDRAPTLLGTSYGGRNKMEDLKAPSPEAWQEPGPSNAKSEGKKIRTSEVIEDIKPSDSHTALRSLMAKEVPEKADQTIETSTPAGDVKSLNRKDGSLASANGKKPKPRSFWRHCVCCSTVH